MTTPVPIWRLREVVDRVLDLITDRIAAAPEEEIDDEMIALAIGLRAWTLTIEALLPEKDRVYVRQMGAHITGSLEVPE